MALSTLGVGIGPIGFVKSFSTKDLLPENYVAAVEVSYADSIAISGAVFAIEAIEMPSPLNYRLLGILFITASIIIFIIEIIIIKKPKNLFSFFNKKR